MIFLDACVAVDSIVFGKNMIYMGELNFSATVISFTNWLPDCLYISIVFFALVERL